MSTYRDVVLGRAPSGLSAPEGSELDSWYDLVAEQQAALLVPLLTAMPRTVLLGEQPAGLNSGEF